MRRGLSLLLAGSILLGGGFSTLGNKEVKAAEGNGNKVTIEMWTVWNTEAKSGSGKILREAAEKFMKENPNIEVKLASQGSYDGIAEKLEAAIVAKNTPTLATVEETHVGRFYPVLSTLSDYLSSELVANYNEGLLKSCTIDGKLKAVPFGRSSTILYMNKNLVEKAGLSLDGPKNWDEFYQYAEKMTDKENGVYGWGQDLDTDAWIWESMLYSYGGEIISPDNKKVLFQDTPASYEIITKMQKMAKEGTLFNPYESQGEAWDILKAKFVEGKVGMMINSIASSSGLAKMAKEKGFEIVVAYQPMGTKNSMPTGGNNIIMFDSATKEQKEAAAKFLTFLAKDEIAAAHTMETGYFPITKTSANHQIILDHKKTFPSYEKAIEQLQFAHSRPMTKNWKNMYTVIIDGLKECMVDTDTDAKEMISNLAEKCQKILDENPD